MKKVLLTLQLSLWILISSVYSQSYTWNGSINSDWNNPTNWTPNGVPGAANDVIINNGSLLNYPLLNSDITILSLVITNGSINLGGFNLNISGAKNSTLSGGTISNGNLNFSIATGNSLTFSGTFTSNANINGNAGRIFFNGGTFNFPVTLTKTGIGTSSIGGSIFNAPINLTNASNFLWRLSNSTPNVYNSTCTFNNTGTNQFQIAYNGVTTITQPFILNATSGSIRIGSNLASVTLNNPINVSGISSSTVIFQNCTFNQSPLNLTLGSNGTFQSISSTFINNFTLTTSRYLSQASTYQSTFILNRNNNTTLDYSFGGNTFNGDVFIQLDGTVGGRFANTNGDVFNSNLSVINNSSANFVFAFNGNNIIQGDLNITNTTNGILTFGNLGTLTINGITSGKNTSTGTIRFSQSTGCTVNFNGIINVNNVGGGSFRFGNGGGASNWNTGVLLNIIDFSNGGNLQLRNINQTDNTLTQSINLPTGVLTIDGCSWNAEIDAVAPSITSTNSIYNNTTTLEKNGAGINGFTGGNVFNGVTEIKNTGTGTLRMATINGDDFNNTVTFTRNAGALVPVYNASSTFAGDVIVNSATTINFNGLANSFAIFDGSGTFQLSASSGVNLFRNVVINNPNLKLVLNNEMQINNVGTLQFNDGLIVLNSKVLRINNSLGSAITRNNGGIVSESTDHNGRVEWNIGTNTDVHEIPFVNNSNEYVPFIVTLTSGDLGIVQASTYGTPANNLPYPIGVTALLNNSAQNNSKYTVDRFFVIIPSGSSYSVNSSFGYGASEIMAPNTIDENFLKAQRWNGTLWEDPVGSVNVALKRVSVTGITQFSPWTLADASEPLPVEFLNFDAKVNGLVVDLNWTTANEKNNSYFSIERSINGTTYESIGRINGSGNTNSTRSYQYVDYNPAKGLSYYRIKQVDFNGAETFSQVRTVVFNQLIGWISYYPNPANSQLTFKLNQTNATEVSVSITNSLGQNVWNNQLNPQTQPEYILDISHWSKGVYLVNIKIDGKVTTSRLIVQ